MDNELKAWLIVNHCLYLGLTLWRQHFNDLSAQTVLENPTLIQQSSLPIAMKKQLLAPNWQEIEKEIDWINQSNCYIIGYFDDKYPQILREISSPPLILYVKGNLSLLSTPQIAIVGSRKASLNAEQSAKFFAKELSLANFTITSGLALGIDAAAHQGALQGSGLTIAVLGTGLNKLYPKANHGLADKICEKGAIVSEFPLNTVAQPRNFPRRNRIISGLSLATLVVEASLQSGSLITAKFALEQNRDVFAIPGSIYNTNNQGCHALIKQGAGLAESPNDILQQLPVRAQAPLKQQHKPQNLTKTEIKLDFVCANMLQYVEFEVTPIDVIIHKSGLVASVVFQQLSELELLGLVHKVAGGYIRKASVI